MRAGRQACQDFGLARGGLGIGCGPHRPAPRQSRQEQVRQAKEQVEPVFGPTGCRRLGQFQRTGAVKLRQGADQGDQLCIELQPAQVYQPHRLAHGSARKLRQRGGILGRVNVGLRQRRRHVSGGER